MPEEKVTKAAKIKRKRWIEVLTPKSFNNEVIGEIPVSEAKFLIGRTVTANLMNLTRDIKKQNTNLKFVITNLQGDKAITELQGYYILPTSVRRIVRRGKERINLSFRCKTSDNKNVRIKPLMVTRKKVKGSISVALKKNTINYLTKQISKTTFENVIRELINSKLQREVKDELKKFYPIKILEVAAFYIEKEKKHVEEEEAGAKAEAKEEPKEEVKEKKSKEEKTAEKKESPQEPKK